MATTAVPALELFTMLLSELLKTLLNKAPEQSYLIPVWCLQGLILQSIAPSEAGAIYL